MLTTLSGRLVTAFVVVISLLGLFYVGLSVYATRLHVAEVNQIFNRTLAANIVRETPIIRDRQVDHRVFEDTFHMLMAINPAIEVYLLDPQGTILAFSAPPGKVKRKSVSIDPIAQLLAGEDKSPVWGDDPRTPDRKKVFSAAPILLNDQVQGFLYIILNSEELDSVERAFETSYILRLIAGNTILGIIVALAVGMLSVRWLTRRLRRLSHLMESYEAEKHPTGVLPPSGPEPGGEDEIDQLQASFRRMSKRIDDQIHQLEQVDASRREMVASISHDLRTPLASLQGYLETLQIKEDTLNAEERQQYLALALEHCHRLGRLIGDLFELATLETGDIQANPEPFSLGELVQDVSQKFALEAERKNIQLSIEVPDDTPFVVADIGLIERVIENLLENALKFTPHRGTVTTSLVALPTGVMTRVSDTGSGIPKQDLPKIFDRFYRVDKARQTASGGTGLGLAIAKRILDLHGRSIEVDSGASGGTSFSFLLPTALD